MLLAKLALGLCGTVFVAGAYTFHEGVMRVDEDNSDGRHVHVWVPAAIVPMAMHVIPNRHFEHAAACRSRSGRRTDSKARCASSDREPNPLPSPLVLASGR